MPSTLPLRRRRLLRRWSLVGTVVVLAWGAAACGGDSADPVSTPAQQADPGAVAPEAPAGAPEPVVETVSPAVPEPLWEPSDGRPRDALMSIPGLDIENLEVRTYVGKTDDAAGHAIQNTGVVASPTGNDGGVGPGGVGNYQVTGHRTSSTRIFEFLPNLTKGDLIRVRSGKTIYVYRVQTTRITSFRSEQSLREQRAAVPGRPGVRATRAKITLSTCRTQEDHAEGNYWSDEFDNPEHRIDKIGVLIRTMAA
ncbi:hypothetical protein GCM10027020_06800 [Nocardioides salsibiostraticola]